MPLPLPDLLKVSTQTAKPSNADTSGAAAASQTKKPAFLTSQTALTLAGASAAINVVWRVADGALGWDSRWVPGIICLIYGAYLFAAGQEGQKMALSDRIYAAFLALVNTALLYGGVLGIDVSLDAADVAEPVSPDVSGTATE